MPSDGPPPSDDPRPTDLSPNGAAADRPAAAGAGADEPSAAEDARLRSALPSTGARALAFLSILVAGLCGGLIGDAFVDLQCTGDCGTARAVGALIGALAGAGGVAVVAILVLRAMTEWRSIEHRQSAPTARRTGRG
jgi:hypothetical protein